jgi:hypothetical protein
MSGVRLVGDDSHSVFRQKLLVEDGSVRRDVVMVKQPGLFSPKFGAMSSHVFTQSPQNIVLEPGIHSLACWERRFALPQLLYRWRHQSGIFWIPPRTWTKYRLKQNSTSAPPSAKLLLCTSESIYVVCLKGSVNGTRKQTKQKIQPH